MKDKMDTEGRLGTLMGNYPYMEQKLLNYTWLDRIEGLAPIYAIDIHRLATDGKGVTTLVAFHKCLLKCKYCINPQTWQIDKISKKMTAKELYDEVKKDNLYFLATGGGITFGGGEPCLHSDFIKQFKEICDPKWKLTIETSLCVESNHIKRLLSIIDYWIIDIKDMDKDCYKLYTGNDNSLVIKNLKYLLKMRKRDQMLVRVPHIPNFNTDRDIENSIKQLKVLGVKNIECFTYEIFPHKHSNLDKRRLLGVPAVTSRKPINNDNDNTLPF